MAATTAPIDERKTGGGGPRLVTLGRVSGAYGLQGWIRVRSDTSPPENIAAYSPWYLVRGAEQTIREVEAGRAHGRGMVVKLAGCDDRDAAEALIGRDIAVRRDQLPDTTEPGEHYWADLVGLRVETLDGVELGHIEQLFETGSNDVMVVQGDRERMIPYIWGQVVREVDLEAGSMRVAWDPDF